MRGLLVVLGLCMAVVAHGQEKISWLTIGEAEERYAKEAKPLLVDVYTDWCGWCKQMDKTTYTQPSVITFINRHFYPVKLNAESADTVEFRGKVYPPMVNGTRHINTLAAELLKGKMSYPTTVFLYDKENMNLVIPGYLDVTKMEAFLVYFSENGYKSSDVNEFVQDFEEVFKARQEVKEEPETYWVPFDSLEVKRKEESKKVLLYLSAPWSNSAKMMERVVFPDSTFASIAQKYFYCLHLDALSQDTVTFMTHQFVNAGQSGSNIHQLAIALSDTVLRVPSVYIFDEEGRLMERLHYYVGRDMGDMVLDFIGSDMYKSMTWADYVKMKRKEGF